MGGRGYGHRSWTGSDPGRPPGAGPFLHSPRQQTWAAPDPPEQTHPDPGVQGKPEGQRADTGHHVGVARARTARTLEPRGHKLRWRWLSYEATVCSGTGPAWLLRLAWRRAPFSSAGGWSL